MYKQGDRHGASSLSSASYWKTICARKNLKKTELQTVPGVDEFEI